MGQSGDIDAESKKGRGPEPKALPRGQKAKLKKIKEKYLDQDEEERELRLAVLGAKASKWLPNQEQTPDEQGPEKHPLEEEVQVPEESVVQFGKGGKGGAKNDDKGKGKAAGKGQWAKEE